MTSHRWHEERRLARYTRPIATLLATIAIASPLPGAMPTTAAAHAVAATTAMAASADYALFDADPMRSGRNTRERSLTPSTVGRLTKLWSTTLDDVADSSPIELTAVDVGGKPLDLLYLTGKSGTAYALDAHTGRRIWTFDATRGESLHGYQITTSTPAADPSHAWIYSASPDGRVHKLAASTGKEAPGWPLRVTLIPQYEKISSSLNVVGRTLLVTTSGYVGDFGHYEGHLVAIDTTTRSTHVFNTLCSDKTQLLVESPGPANYCGAVLNGVWARGGAVVDQMPGSPSAGQIFIVTGNGPYDGRTNWGDSVLRLSLTSSGLELRDAYTPTIQSDLASSDADLGSTTPILLPKMPGAHPWLALQGGKDNRLRLLDRTNLSGKGGPGHLGGELASIPMPQGGAMLTAGLFWQDGSTTWIYVANTNGIAALQIVVRNGTPQLSKAWVSPAYSTSPVLAGGVLYSGGDSGLHAFDPRTGRILWSSTGSSAGGNIGGVHWQSPLVANGEVVMPDMNRAVTAYGVR